MFASDIYAKIFSYLSWSEVIKCGIISKAWSYLVKSQSIWKNLYYQTWPELVEYEKEAHSHEHESEMNCDPVILTPWYHLFKYRYTADKNFKVICVCVQTDHVEYDMGFRLVLNQRQYEYDQRSTRFKDFWNYFLKWDENDLFECLVLFFCLLCCNTYFCCVLLIL